MPCRPRCNRSLTENLSATLAVADLELLDRRRFNPARETNLALLGAPWSAGTNER